MEKGIGVKKILNVCMDVRLDVRKRIAVILLVPFPIQFTLSMSLIQSSLFL